MPKFVITKKYPNGSIWLLESKSIHYSHFKQGLKERPDFRASPYSQGGSKSPYRQESNRQLFDEFLKADDTILNWDKVLLLKFFVIRQRF